MAKITLKRPLLVYFYGFPGSGKSFVASSIGQHFDAVLISENKIRGELFENPRFGAQENQLIQYVMDYLADQFLKAGMSVIYDVNANRASHRRSLRSLAAQHKADPLLIWIQIDPESAFTRTQARDKRRTENRYQTEQTREVFDNQLAKMENPGDEPYVVISGKHSFATQKSAILSRLYHMGMVDSNVMQTGVAAPGLINLVPMPSVGQVDLNRRNISIS